MQIPFCRPHSNALNSAFSDLSAHSRTSKYSLKRRWLAFISPHRRAFAMIVSLYSTAQSWMIFWYCHHNTFSHANKAGAFTICFWFLIFLFILGWFQRYFNIFRQNFNFTILFHYSWSPYYFILSRYTKMAAPISFTENSACALWGVW